MQLFDCMKLEVYRATPEGYKPDPVARREEDDLITNNGRIFLANRIGDDTTGTNSPMVAIAVGTVSTAASIGDSSITGEVARNGLAVNTAETNNIYTATSTFGGAADSVTSLSLREVGLLNMTTSGQGVLFQRVTFAAVTLADSDFLSVTLQTNVGSNTI